MTILTAWLLCILFIIGLVTLFLVWRSNKVHHVSNKLLGQPAPDFALPDETNALRSLREFRGKKIVFYFYPKDDTPGCSKQACSFRDAENFYQDHNIVVIGINYDTPETHRQFKQKYELPFTLLSDMKKQVSGLYGARHGFGPEPFPRRITFLINEQGIITHIIENVEVEKYATEVLKKLGIE